MQYFTVQGRTHLEALEKMKMTQGPSARVLTHRSIRHGGFLGLFQKAGVEITGYISTDPARLRDQSMNNRESSLEDEKKKILESANKSHVMQQILREIKDLKSEIPNITVDRSHPTLGKIEELLKLNEFADIYIEKMVKRLKAEFPLDDLNDFTKIQGTVLEWIGEGIMTSSNGKTRPANTRIISIIGPTGVGKTTTVAKLAAIYGLEGEYSPPLQVRMITIDNYKIAAKKQIETYADIMRIPVSFAETRSDLEKTLDLYRDVDIILIDTIGKSPNDFSKLGEMRTVLEACGSRGETHLAISATTKTSDVVEVLRQFEPFSYSSVILTKLDETYRIGNIISILDEMKKSFSYITDGQMVPQDIEPASVSRLLLTLEGFRYDREQIDKKFSPKVVDTEVGR